MKVEVFTKVRRQITGLNGAKIERNKVDADGVIETRRRDGQRPKKLRVVEEELAHQVAVKCEPHSNFKNTQGVRKAAEAKDDDIVFGDGRVQRSWKKFRRTRWKKNNERVLWGSEG